MAENSEKLVILAAVVGAHGITGEVRLKLFTDDLARYPALTGNGRPLTLKSVRPGPNGAVARFAEVTDRNAAEAMRGTQIAVPRASLPDLGDDEYYHADLIGEPAVSTAGDELGRIVDVVDYGAGDLIEIERPDGKRFLVPIKAGVDDLGPPIRVHAEFVEA
ncbi:ribosome maturation factor RimM [Sphingomonas abietis]|uniref:Ribosome maturation factor RimM n=1 Tax=Sphingomonas abietis TaxID=3012344 RepID=A0ABY7NLH5_9SPHN|nr:ribosome maturation factor RimM [Sphingomonas abietis]WBO21427.1 ribosome maturation factor RimM [Sphingomonas abietis]